MVRSLPCLLALITLLGASPASAADQRVVGPSRAPAPAVVEQLPPGPPGLPPPVDMSKATGPLMAPPQVRFGCQRVWRCDTTICEWRRGCWGVYGYLEGPYYTPSFARRQAEQHGWIFPLYNRSYK